MNAFRQRVNHVYATVKTKLRFSSNSAIQIKEIRVPVPWGHIAVKQWGDNNLPLIICDHGFMDNAGGFDTLIPILPRRFCYLAIDKPGHGLSSHAGAGLPYNDELYLQSLDYVRRYYGNQRVGLMGYSMGSAHCLYYIHAYPKYVRFLIASELTSMPDNPTASRIQHLGRRIDKIMQQENCKKHEPIRPKNVILGGMIQSWGGSIDKSAAEILLKRAVEPVGEGWRLTRDRKCQNNQVLGQNTFAILNPLPKPYDIKMCIIEATEGVRFASTYLVRETLKVMAKKYGYVEYHALKGKHHMHLTHPHKVSPIITNFLNKYAP